MPGNRRESPVVVVVVVIVSQRCYSGENLPPREREREREREGQNPKEERNFLLATPIRIPRQT